MEEEDGEGAPQGWNRPETLRIVNGSGGGGTGAEAGNVAQRPGNAASISFRAVSRSMNMHSSPWGRGGMIFEPEEATALTAFRRPPLALRAPT